MTAIAVHHHEAGPANGPSLVLVNSLGSDLTMWDPQMPAFVERWRVIRYDLRGHGRSAAPPGPYRMEDLGQDLVGLLDELGIERASLCGSSIGGMVAIWVAAHAPERVDRLVAVGASARLGSPASWADRAAMVRDRGIEAVVDAVVARWVTAAYATAHPDDISRWRRMVAATSAEGYAGCCDAIETMDLRDDLAAIRAPTLIVAGAEDPAVPGDDPHELARCIPGARLAVMDGTAHLPNLEDPDPFNALLRAHLEGREEMSP